MIKRITISLGVALVLAACGGEGGDAPAPKTASNTPPSTTTTATTPPATTSTGSTEATPPPAKPSMIELQKKAGANMAAAWNAHDSKKCAENYASDGVISELGPTGWMDHKGKDEIEKNFATIFAGYPDSKMGVSRVFAAKNIAVVQWVMTGTNTGEMMGMKATGKPVGFNGASVLWFNDDGLIAKEHVYLDAGTIMGQEGVSKQKVRPVATLPSGEPEWITPKGDGSDDKSVTAFNAQLDALNKHDAKAFGATVTDDTVHIDYTAAEDVKGKAAGEKEMAGYFKAFPDLKANADNVWGFGDFVIDETTITGTQTGALGPIKPTKKPITSHMVEVNVIKDGKVAKCETYWSSVELMGQLGLLPKPKEEKGTKTPAAKTTATPATTGTPAPKTTTTPATTGSPAPKTP